MLSSEPSELISQILSSTAPMQIFDFSNYKDKFQDLAKIIHPDKCGLPKANDAFVKINEYKSFFEKGFTFSDGVCEVNVKDKIITLVGDIDILKLCLKNYNTLMSFKDKSSLHFQKYLPLSGEIKNGKLYFTSTKYVATITDKTLPQEHVRWILSRLLEFSAWLEKIGFTHAGITPDSFVVVPEIHNILMISFYHLEKTNEKLKTISGKYLNWYDFSVFKEKKAITAIDITMAKKCAIYLLGDKSGNGVKLRTTLKAEFVDFLLKLDIEAVECFKNYRSIIDKLYKKEYFELVI